MKILILQLARLGDIYLTWPVVRAIKRINPAAEVHMLVRQRFEGATVGLSELDHIHVLPNREILEPLAVERPDLEASCCRLENFLDSLQSYQFDEVINLSFSPLSSYLTHTMESWGVRSLGFTRHTDGYLNFADEVSAYFHAQVGPQKENRCHLSDLFASMMGITLTESDWTPSSLKQKETQGVVVHIGASEAHKRLSPDEYTELVQGLYRARPSLKIILIGSKEERPVGDWIKQRVPVREVNNLVGQTDLQDLFELISGAEMFIGCDSGPMHIASLTNTMTFNISLGNVNFWETGPKAQLSYISQMSQFPEQRNMSKAVEQILSLMEGKVSSELITRVEGKVESYQIPGESQESQFSWQLIQAMYLGGPYPVLDHYQVYLGMQQIQQVNNLLIEQYRKVTANSASGLNELVLEADRILQNISQNQPALRPIVDWMMTEKVRIHPAHFEQVKSDTLKIHENLAQMLKHYLGSEVGVENGSI